MNSPVREHRGGPIGWAAPVWAAEESRKRQQTGVVMAKRSKQKARAAAAQLQAGSAAAGAAGAQTSLEPAMEMEEERKARRGRRRPRKVDPAPLPHLFFFLFFCACPPPPRRIFQSSTSSTSFMPHRVYVVRTAGVHAKQILHAPLAAARAVQDWG